MSKPFLLGAAIAIFTCFPGCTRSSSPPAAEQAEPTPDEPPGEPAQPAEAPRTDQPATAADFHALSAEQVASAIKPHLQPGETLAHQVFRGPLGPARDTALVIVDRDGSAAGFVLLPGAADQPGSVLRRVNLPALSMGLLDSVPAVLFMDADGRPGVEAIIMTRQMTGAGPEGAIPRHFNLVLAWRQGAFVRLDELEEKILDMATAAEIKKTLAAATPAPAEVRPAR